MLLMVRALFKLYFQQTLFLLFETFFSYMWLNYSYTKPLQLYDLYLRRIFNVSKFVYNSCMYACILQVSFSLALPFTFMYNMLELLEVQTRDNRKQRKSKKTLSVFLCTIDRENLHGKYWKLVIIAISMWKGKFGKFILVNESTYLLGGLRETFPTKLNENHTNDFRHKS